MSLEPSPLPPAAVRPRHLVETSADLVRTPSVVPSPHLEAAEAAAAAWVSRLGLVEGERGASRFAAIRCGSFAAHTYPHASAEVVELGAHLISWLYLFDDAVGERCEDLHALERSLQGFERLIFAGEMPAAPTPFHHALAELRARVGAAGGDALVIRLAYSLRRYFDGCLLEYPYRTTGRSPSLSVYRSLRRWSIGGLPVFDLIELTLPHRLDDAMVNKESYWRLRDTASILCAWANDLYSFHKERHDRDPHNLVSVLMRERDLSDADAFADAVRLYNADLAGFERLLDSFTLAPSSTRLEVAYMRGLCDWVYGNHQWTRTCRRYA